MNHWNSAGWDAGVLGMAALLALASFRSVGSAPELVPTPLDAERLSSVMSANVDLAIAGQEDSSPSRMRWSEARLSTGEAFDLFTSPLITQAGENQPLRFGRTWFEQEEDDFGVELVAVRQEPFRLQLVGFVAEGARVRGVFEQTGSSDVILALAGRELPALALRIERIELATLDESAADGGARRAIAIAEVTDLRTGETVLLSSHQRQSRGSLLAEVREPLAAEGKVVPARGEWDLGGRRYRVERLVASPPSAEISRLKADGSVETRSLQPLVR